MESLEETKEKLDARISLVKDYGKKAIGPAEKKDEPADLFVQSKALQLASKRPFAPSKLSQPFLYRKKKRIDID